MGHNVSIPPNHILLIHTTFLTKGRYLEKIYI